MIFFALFHLFVFKDTPVGAQALKSKIILDELEKPYGM